MKISKKQEDLLTEKQSKERVDTGTRGELTARERTVGNVFHKIFHPVSNTIWLWYFDIC
jgi:hypothetical protein